MNICECPVLNPMQRDGTSQIQRFLYMLDPAYVLSDERTLEDILVFAKNYAALVRYHDTNENNAGIDENWVGLIEKDISSLVSVISTTDQVQIREDYNQKYSTLKKITGKSNFKSYVDFIFEQVVLIDKWYASAIEEHSLKKDLEIIINSTLKFSYEDLIRQIKNADKIAGSSLGFDYPHLNPIWGVDPSAITADVSSETWTKSLVLEISTKINSVFESFHNTIVRLVGDTPKYLYESIQSCSNHQPHIALFIVFIILFTRAQENLNEVTRKHLDFYYKDVLQLKAKDAVPDKVHLIFELAKNISRYELKKNTSLKAGKDAAGKNLFYSTEKDIVLNRAVAASMRTIFIEKNFDGESNPIRNIYSAPVANSPDGKGKAFDEEGAPWSTFGKSQWDEELNAFLPEESRTMELTKIGFAVSSPQLFLNEGIRNITLTINFEDEGFELPELKKNVKKENFKCYLSGAKEWIEIQLADDNLFAAKKLTLKFTVSQELPAVTKYDREKLGYSFNTGNPVLLILLNEASTPYEFLKRLKINSISIKVHVEGVRKLVLQNDSALLNPDKPFYPFGTLPVIDSAFYIGSKEVFSKKIDSLKLNISWHGLPAEEFGTYYSAYKTTNEKGETTFAIKNDSFKTIVNVLENNKWSDDKTELNLFEASIVTNQSKTIQKTGLLKNRDSSVPDITGYNSEVNRGFVKLEMAGTDFQHKKYPKLLTETVVNKGTGTITLPNEPYTPLIKELTLEYISEQNFESKYEKFFHVLPFGVYESLPVSGTEPDKKAVNTNFLLPQFTIEEAEQEGFLFIGLEKFSAGSNISLLFKVAESSGDASLEYPKDINWCCLSDNKWIKLDRVNILSDTTNDLRTTGIIELEIPKNATSDDTVMPAGYHWLCASVDENSQAVNKLINVKAQALVAIFTDRGNDPDHLAEPLKAETISKLEYGISEIKSIAQPYASFGGKTKEVSKDFYTRISERLRHKNRSINIFDYERIVLDKFPSIYKVKCINHTNQCSEIAPGNVTVIPISNLRNQNAVDLLKPRTSVNTLYEIETHLRKLNSPFINLEVANPQYEEIKVESRVYFYSGYDKGYYSQKLNDEIIKFLSPWAYDEGADIVFGGKIHASYILNFIEEREYVDYVTDFKMFHIIGGVIPLNNVELAVATTSRSILVSYNRHKVDYA
jgi:hypothetical protein